MRDLLIRTSAIMLALFCVAAFTGVALAINPSCGDGQVNTEVGETCDPPSLPAPNGSDCRDDCTFCGDGIMDEGEFCDDGNSNNMDDCANDCTIPVQPVCGDGNVDSSLGETCDPPGSMAGANGNVCRDDCTVCGDGIMDDGEECDDGDADNFDECDNDCTVGPECGDGFVDSATGETCDPPSLPAPNGSDCRDDCTYCGDGYMDVGEECDDGDSDDMDECSNDCLLPMGGEGCTPGYWKNKTFAWDPTPYDPGMLVRDVFTLPAMFDSIGDTTLRAALRWSSGDLPIEVAENLVKHAIAALLNASHPDVAYSYSAGEILAAVNAALAVGDPTEMDDLHMDFDSANNDGCPLSGRAPRADLDSKDVQRKQLDTRIKSGRSSGSSEAVRF
jgi:cysteine-rich repeat protein